MTENYTCPRCGGGFEEPVRVEAIKAHVKACPWCELKFGEYEL